MTKIPRSLSSLLVASGCLLPSAPAAQGESTPRLPNIVLIYADDLGYGDLSCYGGLVPTPRSDSLAQQGVQMMNAHTVASTSTPSRFGLLTGVHPWRQAGTRIAAGDAGMVIRPERYTLADAAKKAGYHTGAIGKWHLGIGETAKQDWNGHITPNLADIGFDHSYIMAATGDRVPCVFIENGRVANYDPTAPISVSYKKPFAGEPTGRKNPELLKVHPSHGHDQAIINGISRIGYMKGGGKALWVDEDFADVIAEQARDYILKNKDKPFFLYVGTHDIHVPRIPHARFVGKSGMGARGDAILQFDFQVGAILDALEAAGVAQDTLVILSSDNGPVLDDGYHDEAVEKLGNHRPAGKYRGGKYSAFEAGGRVPMLVRWTSTVPMGQKSHALMSQIDLMASLSALMKAPLPAGKPLDSRNELKTLLGTDLTGGSTGIIKQNTAGSRIYLSGRWKYIPANRAAAYNRSTRIELGNNPKDQLYDLVADPGETQNLAEEQPQQLQKMKEGQQQLIARPVK